MPKSGAFCFSDMLRPCHVPYLTKSKTKRIGTGAMNGSNLARVQSCGWPPGSFYMSFVSLSVNAGSDFTRNALALPMVATRRRASLGGLA